MSDDKGGKMTPNDDPISETRLREIIAAYGADPVRWPGIAADHADDLLRQYPRLRATLSEAQDLDAALDQLPAPEPSRALPARIRNLPRAMDKRRSPGLMGSLMSVVWPAVPLRVPVSVFGIAAALGLMVGVLTSNPSSDLSEGPVLLGDNLVSLVLMIGDM